MPTRTSLAAPGALAILAGLASAALAFVACSSFSEDPGASVTPEASTSDAPLLEDGGTGTGAETGAEAAASSAYRAAILADAPLAYWRMGIASGLSIPDESGHGNALLLQGAGVTLGKPGATSDGDSAIELDGLSGLAVADKPRAFDFPDKAPFTLELWARYTPIDGGSSFPTLFSAVDGFNASANGYLFYVVKNVDKVQLNYGEPALVTGAMPGGATWTHYAVTFDGTKVTLLIGGTEIASAAATGVSSSRKSGFGVGGRPQNSSGFPGGIDEVAVYDKALSIGQLLAHVAAR